MKKRLLNMLLGEKLKRSTNRVNETVHQLGEIGIIPVVAIDDAANAVPLGKALLAGGLPCAEITFRTAAAAEAILTRLPNWRRRPLISSKQPVRRKCL
jgi:hypothetical protein